MARSTTAHRPGSRHRHDEHHHEGYDCGARRSSMMMRQMAGYGGGVGTNVTPTEIVIGANVVARWRFIPAR